MTHPLTTFPTIPRANPADSDDSGVESEDEWVDDFAGLAGGPPSRISQAVAKEVC